MTLAHRLFQVVASAFLFVVCSACCCTFPIPPRVASKPTTASTPSTVTPPAEQVEPPAGPHLEPAPPVDPPKPPAEPPKPPVKMTDADYFVQLVRVKRINEPNWMPELVRDPRKVKVYDHCQFTYKALQVLTAESCLIEFGDETLVLHMDTSGVVDGRSYEVEGIFRAAGRVQYTTVLGATRTVQAIRYSGRMPDLPPVEKKTEPKPEKKPVPPPKPLPTVTLTPPKGEKILLGYAAGAITPASDEIRTKWLADGKLIELVEATKVEVVERGKTTTRVKFNGKEWFVDSRWVPADK